MIHINHLLIQKIAHCPRQYELDLMQVAPVTISPALFLGGTFHLVQKTYFTTKMSGVKLSRDDIVTLFEQFWKDQAAAEGREIDWRKTDIDEQHELGKAMIKAYYPYACAMQPVLVEQKLYRDLTYCTVSGIIDLIISTGSVIDYKSSVIYPYQTDIDRDLQPTIYDFIVGGIKDFQYHYIIKDKIPVVRIYHTKRREQDRVFLTEALIPMTVKFINSGVSPPFGIYNGACHWCSYKGFCASYQ